MNLAGMDLNLLLVFDAVMAERNVTRAAKRIGLSQPAMSNALNRLRYHLKDELFVRGAFSSRGPHWLTVRQEVVVLGSIADEARSRDGDNQSKNPEQDGRRLPTQAVVVRINCHRHRIHTVVYNQGCRNYFHSPTPFVRSFRTLHTLSVSFPCF